MSNSFSALHVTTSKVSASQITLRPTYPYSAPNYKKNYRHDVAGFVRPYPTPVLAKIWGVPFRVDL